MAEEQRDVTLLVEGLSKLRTGAIIILIGIILEVAGIFMAPGLLSIFAMTGAAPSPGLTLGALVTPLALLIIGVLLGIVAFILWFSATGKLKAYDPSRLGIGRTGMILQLVGVILIFLGLLAIVPVIFAAGSTGSPEMLIGAIYGMLGLVGLGAILALVGLILFGIMIMRLGEIQGVDPGFRTAGILYILTLIPYVGPILQLIAVIMIYVYAGRSIEALTAEAGVAAA